MDKLSKLEQSAANLKAYTELLLKAKKAIRSINTYKKDKAIRLVSAIADKLKETRKPRALQYSAKCLDNELWSIIDYLKQDKPIKVTQIDRAIKDAQDFDVELKKRMENAKAGLKDWEADDLANLERTLKRAGEESKDLSEALNKEWVLCRAPVILVGTTLNTARLSELFDASNISGYPVLHKQLVLGINRTLASKNGHTDVTAYRDNLIKAIARDRGLKLYNICERGMVRPESGASVFWFWLMTDHDARLFRQAFSTINRQGLATIHVKEWGFAC